MVVHEKCPACQAEVEIILENARKQNECPSCGHTFIPRHAINPAGFHAEKPKSESYTGIGILAVGLIVVGVIISLFVSLLIGLVLLVAGVIVFLMREIASKKK